MPINNKIKGMLHVVRPIVKMVNARNTGKNRNPVCMVVRADFMNVANDIMYVLLYVILNVGICRADICILAGT